MPGPLVPLWRSVSHGTIEAGKAYAVEVEAENAGSAPWRTRGVEDGLFLSYHWLDERGNPIVWDGDRTPLEGVIAPGGIGARSGASSSSRSPGAASTAVRIPSQTIGFPRSSSQWYETLRPRQAADPAFSTTARTRPRTPASGGSTSSECQRTARGPAGTGCSPRLSTAALV